MVTVITKPENLREILLSVDLRLAEKGMTRADFALHECNEKPNILANLLNGRTKADQKRHSHIIGRVNELTGATMEAWER